MRIGSRIIKEVYMIRDWSARKKTVTSLLFRGSVASGVTSDVITYTVPSGKTLYITDYALWGKDEGTLWFYSSEIDDYIFGDACVAYQGRTHGFTLPLRISAGYTLTVRITNPTSASVYYETWVWGYEI